MINLTNKITTLDQRIANLHYKKNDLFWLFKNGSMLQADFIEQRNKINDEIIKLQKENKNEQI